MTSVAHADIHEIDSEGPVQARNFLWGAARMFVDPRRRQEIEKAASRQMAMQKSVKKTKGAKAAKGAERAPPAQQRFLMELIGERRPVAIFLVNGLKLEGRIASFDDYAILLEGELSDHVYKHAISTIQPLTNTSPRVEISTKKRAPRAVAEVDFVAKPRATRQPTIVVRTRRRLIKTTTDES